MRYAKLARELYMHVAYMSAYRLHYKEAKKARFLTEQRNDEDGGTIIGQFLTITYLLENSKAFKNP